MYVFKCDSFSTALKRQAITARASAKAARQSDLDCDPSQVCSDDTSLASSCMPAIATTLADTGEVGHCKVSSHSSTLGMAMPSNTVSGKAGNPQLVSATPLVHSSETLSAQSSVADKFATDMPRLLTYEEVKMSVYDLPTGHFTYIKDNTNITFVKLSDDVHPIIEISVVITDDFQPHVDIWGRPLTSKSVPDDIFPPTIDSLKKIENLLQFLGNAKLCYGVTEEKLIRVAVGGNSARVRSDNCRLISLDDKACFACRALRKRLCMKLLRSTKSPINSNLAKSRRRNSYMASPLKKEKLRQLAAHRKHLVKENCALKSKLAMYEQKCQRLIEEEGVQLPDTDNEIMQQLTQDCQDVDTNGLEPDSFQSIFLQQQIKYNRLKTKSSMRWHPAIIRWCLFIHSRSAKAYDGMRSYLNLPSRRTLFDYTHYTESGMGINPKTVAQLIENAKQLGCFDAEHKSYVGILQDEIKIKSDLVYHKSTGKLIGYINLDQVSSEILNLNDDPGKSKDLAESVLVIMVRGITSSMRYPLAAYATKTLSASTLYSILWECVECLEIVVGLKVMYICCDGAVQNRKFFKLHGTSDSQLNNRTRNPYAVEERDIFFISDPPHLLKTARNCFANSDAHSKTRSLWNGKTISWKHVVKLYEDHCEQTELRLCPKLTRNHLYLTSFSKMRVSLAAQILSATVANGLQMIYGDAVSSTVEFVRILNKWFDIMNVKNLHESRNTRNNDLAPFTCRDDPRLAWLENDFPKYFEEWEAAVNARPGNFSRKQKEQMKLSHQTVDGLKLTSVSVAAVVRKLLDAGAPFVMTSHLNQDPLEQLFGHCRHKGGSNDNPNVLEACNSINNIRSVNTQAVACTRGNTAPERMKLDCSKIPKRNSKTKMKKGVLL